MSISNYYDTYNDQSVTSKCCYLQDYIYFEDEDNDGGDWD